MVKHRAAEFVALAEENGSDENEYDATDQLRGQGRHWSTPQANHAGTMERYVA